MPVTIEQYEQIIDEANAFYGLENRKIKVIEECSELIKEVAKLQLLDSNTDKVFLGRTETNKKRQEIINKICDEISDVQIVIDSFKKFLPENLLDKYKSEKILRLQERIK